MNEVVWSKIHGLGVEVASCWYAISESASEGTCDIHARGTFRAQQGGLKYLLNSSYREQSFVLLPRERVVVVGEPRAGRSDLVAALRRVLERHGAAERMGRIPAASQATIT
jgi:hypothetical protein